LVAVILKSDKTWDAIPMSWNMGLDYLKIKRADGSDLDDIALMPQNKEAMSGGPMCIFHGKELPCHVNVSPNASITSEMLAKMLSDIDHSEIFNRQLGQPKPFLLLDGHHS
jgi:hypothetical protein